MDKLDRTLSGIINSEKSLSDSMIQFNQLQNQMTQGINKSSEWLFKKESQMSKINSEFDMIRKEIR